MGKCCRYVPCDISNENVIKVHIFCSCLPSKERLPYIGDCFLSSLPNSFADGIQAEKLKRINILNTLYSRRAQYVCSWLLTCHRRSLDYPAGHTQMPRLKYLCPGHSMPWFCGIHLFHAYLAAVMARTGAWKEAAKEIITATLTKIPSEYLLMMHKVFIKLETAPTAMRGCRLD